MKAFKSTTQHTIQIPMTVTKAADTLATICNRDDTQQVVGIRMRGTEREGYHITIDYDTMSFIIGAHLAENFLTAMAQPGYAEYFSKINARLVQVGITLAWSSEYWFLHKLPAFQPENEQQYIYTYRALEDQAPNGFNYVRVY